MRLTPPEFEFTDQGWDLLAPSRPSASTGRPRVDDRRVINGMAYKIRTGLPWRDLPGRYGPWQTVYTRFSRYALSGVFTQAPIRSRPKSSATGAGPARIHATIARPPSPPLPPHRRGTRTGRVPSGTHPNRTTPQVEKHLPQERTGPPSHVPPSLSLRFCAGAHRGMVQLVNEGPG
ncbi:transposase [Streptomyces sp. NPDC098101]|uniref:transposase n=1 Tax=Streptomyces sp. NPDC098101 TaxID=3366096 RepID=UPI0037F5BFA8